MLKMTHHMRLLGCALLLAPAAAMATGSGTLDDQTLAIDYQGGPYYVPLPLTEVTGLAGNTPPCAGVNGESLICDYYYLSVNISDAVRDAPENAKAEIDIVLDSAGEYDFFLFDAEGNLMPEPDHVATPETLSLPLRTLKNGDYAIQIVPWMATAETFDLSIATSAVSAGTSKSGLQQVFGGALMPVLLLPLLLAGLRRR